MRMWLDDANAVNGQEVKEGEDDNGDTEEGMESETGHSDSFGSSESGDEDDESSKNEEYIEDDVGSGAGEDDVAVEKKAA